MDYTAQEKLDILKTVYKELHSSRKSATSFENRIAFSFSSVFLLLAALILTGDYKIDKASVLPVVCFIALATILAIWFLIRNGALIRLICQMIVRIEQIMGLHTDGIYISKQDVEKMLEFPFPDTRVFPSEVQFWGSSHRWQSMTPHIFAVLFAGIAPILALILN